MMHKLQIIYILWQVLSFRLIYSHPVHLEENSASGNSRLQYLGKRLEWVASHVQAEFLMDLKQLQEAITQHYASADIDAINEFLASFDEKLRPEFATYLQEKFDEQILNAEINFEVWYLTELGNQLNATFADEIAARRADYERVLHMENINEKYDSFTQVQDKYSAELSAILNAQPEPASIVNIDLIFTYEYLEYLLEQSIGVEQFRDKLTNALAEVELALNADDVDIKENVMEFYDDLETEFGRFLFDNMHEYWLLRFIN